jgi:hypothetical protein
MELSQWNLIILVYTNYNLFKNKSSIYLFVNYVSIFYVSKNL